MAELVIAEVILGVGVFIFATISIVFDNLLPNVRDHLSPNEYDDYVEAAYLSTFSAFMLTLLGIAFFVSGILGSLDITPSVIGVPPDTAFYIGTLAFVASIAFPTGAAIVTSFRLYREIR